MHFYYINARFLIGWHVSRVLITFLYLHSYAVLVPGLLTTLLFHRSSLYQTERENDKTDTECPSQLLPILSVCQASEGEITGPRIGRRPEGTCLAELLKIESRDEPEEKKVLLPFYLINPSFSSLFVTSLFFNI